MKLSSIKYTMPVNMHTHTNASVKLLQLLAGGIMIIQYVSTTLPGFCPKVNNIQQTLHIRGFVHCTFTYLWKTCCGNLVHHSVDP